MISVCIASYNGEKYIEEQLLSILCQLDVKDEIIVSDDSSTDNTLDKVKGLHDDRIKLFPRNKFHSPIFNFENALKKANGDIIFLCDQDDIWLPNKVNVMVEQLNKCDLVVSDCKVVDGNLNILQDSFFSSLNSGPGFCKNLIKNTYLGCCMAFRRDILDYVLPFPRHIAMHDIWIGLSVELHGCVSFINQPLMLYRRHGNNVSFGGEKSYFSLWYRIKYRLEMLYYLLRRNYLNS